MDFMRILFCFRFAFNNISFRKQARFGFFVKTNDSTEVGPPTDSLSQGLEARTESERAQNTVRPDRHSSISSKLTLLYNSAS